MINRVFFKGDFIKNTAVLIMGTGIAQILPLLFSPILTRIYTPNDFGKLAFFMALCSIISIVATGLYELSIMLPEKDTTALNILFLVIILAFIISIIIFIIILIFGSNLVALLNSPISSEYLLLLPVGIFFTGGFQGLNYWLNRKKQYKVISRCRITQSITTLVSSLVLGYFGYKSYGLIIGFLIGCIFSVIPLVPIIFKRINFISELNIFNAAKTYKDYPKLMMPSSLMNITATQAPIFFINKFFSSNIVGHFSFASRILTAPIGVISSSIGQIYFQKISEITRKGNINLYPTFLKTSKTLFYISFLLFLPFFLFGEDIFRIVFGENWSIAGRFVEVISIGAFIKFIVSPLSTIFISTNNLRTVAFWQTSYFCTTIIIFFFFRNSNFISLLSAYIVHECIMYLLYYCLMIYVSKKFDRKKSSLPI